MRKTILACTATALVIGGGTATASSLITGSQIKNGTLTSADVKNGSLRGSDLHNGTIGRSKLSRSVRNALGAGAQSGPAGKVGPQGPAGANGTNGATGPQGPAGNDGTHTVRGPGQGFSATNPSVHFTSGGVTYGPYDDNSQGGSLVYDGYDGKPLGDLAEVSYSASYHHKAGTPDNGDAPYLRIFTKDSSGDDHDIVFSPSSQPGACYGGGGPSSPECDSSDRLVKYDVHEGTVRYDDDPGSTPDQPWARVVDDHKSETISRIVVTTGFSLPGTQSAVLNSLRLEIAGSAPTIFTFAA